MTPREELDLILDLIRKYNLPLSPILEYAVNEKKDDYPEEKKSVSVDFIEDIDKISSTIQNDQIGIPPVAGGINEIHGVQKRSNKKLHKKQNAVIVNKKNKFVLSSKVTSPEQKLFQDFMTNQKSNFNKPFSLNTIRQYSTALTSNEVQKILSMFAGNPNIFEIDDMQIIDDVIRYIKESSDISFTKGPVISALNHFVIYKTSNGLSPAKQRDSVVSSDTDQSLIKGTPGEPTLSVLFPDGKRIKEFYSSQTFIRTLICIGVEKIRNLHIKISNKALIVKRNEPFSKSVYKRLDKNHYVYRLDNERRISVLRDISEKLNLNIKVNLSI